MVEQMAHYLAICVFNVYQMLNIDTYVFGGGLADFEGLVFGKTQKEFGKMREEFDKYNHIPLPVHFKLAELKNDMGIIGAAEIVKAAIDVN
jgi:glucokinase